MRRQAPSSANTACGSELQTRPVIAITGESAALQIVPAEESPVYGVPQTYVDALAAVGASAVIIPPVPHSASAVRRFDGLLLSGGPDLSPALYGATAMHPALKLGDRDNAELDVLRAALDAGLPILGVCRGMQLLAVHFGGTLHQHLPDAMGHDRHCPDGRMGVHGVRFSDATLVNDIYGPNRQVNSFHHQGVADTGVLVACGWADDGLVEAVQYPDLPFVLGVQWHPEKSDLDRELFRRFVDRCRPTVPAPRHDPQSPTQKRRLT